MSESPLRAPAESELTSAILYHRLRGSGREVLIRLGAHGLELTSPAGADIAIWPYATIRAVDRVAIPEWPQTKPWAVDRTAIDAPYILEVPHDELHELRLTNQAWVAAITERSPGLHRARRSARLERFMRIWSGVPDQGRAAIILGAVFLVLWTGSRIFSWVADLW